MATREENKTLMENVVIKLKDAASRYNDLIDERKTDDAAKLKGEVEELISKYNTASLEVCFYDCQHDGTLTPMQKACKMMTFPIKAITLNVQSNVGGVQMVTPMVINDRTKIIDLIALDQRCGGIGFDKNWIHYADALNYRMTLKIAKELEDIDPQQVMANYALSEAAKEIKFGDADPTSKTQILKSLTKVVQAMIGPDFHPVKKDIYKMFNDYTKKGKKAHDTTVCNRKSFLVILMETCQRAMDNSIKLTMSGYEGFKA